VATTALATTTTAATVSTNSSVLKAPIAGVPDGYLTPPTPFKATSTIPGKGGTVKIYLISYNPPPPPRSENKYWQELEKRLGTTWELTLSPQDTYAEKLDLLTASGDLPDLTFLDLDYAPEQLKLIQQGAYTDLTSFLNADAIKAYPNLAAYPAQLWKNAAINGKIYGIPRPRFLIGSADFWRKDWAAKIGMPAPKNSEDFYKLMEAFTKQKPDDTQPTTWGIGFTQGEISSQTVFMNMFGVPNLWQQNSNGDLTYFIESPQYKAAIAFMRRLWAAGLVYPDSLTQTKQQSQDNFVAGKYGVWQDSLTGLPGPSGRRATAQKINPKADIVPFIPPGADGGKPVAWLGSGYFGFTAIPSKVGKDKDRVAELLQIVNYLASPFGSDEYNFLTFGVDNVHNTLKSDGTRVLNDLGKKEISELPRVANGPQVLYYPGYPEQVSIMQDGIRQMVEVGISNPALLAVSNTFTNKSKELNQLIEDRIVRIITGRDDINALDDLIKEWKSRGGTQIAQEFAQSLKG
jgi:putative aldouronate transport system substrate-binding protein